MDRLPRTLRNRAFAWRFGTPLGYTLWIPREERGNSDISTVSSKTMRLWHVASHTAQLAKSTSGSKKSYNYFISSAPQCMEHQGRRHHVFHPEDALSGSKRTVSRTRPRTSCARGHRARRWLVQRLGGAQLRHQGRAAREAHRDPPRDRRGPQRDSPGPSPPLEPHLRRLELPRALFSGPASGRATHGHRAPLERRDVNVAHRTDAAHAPRLTRVHALRRGLFFAARPRLHVAPAVGDHAGPGGSFRAGQPAEALAEEGL